MIGGTGQSGTSTASGHDGDGAELILGQLGALLLEVGLSVTDVRAALETVRDSSAIDREALAFSVLPEMVIVTATRTGAATVVNATAVSPKR